MYLYEFTLDKAKLKALAIRSASVFSFKHVFNSCSFRETSPLYPSSCFNKAFFVNCNSFKFKDIILLKLVDKMEVYLRV